MPLGRRRRPVYREGHRTRPDGKVRHRFAGGYIRNQQTLPDYRVETAFRKVNEHAAEVTISHYYSTPSLKARLFNLVEKRKIARETEATLNAVKVQIEHGDSDSLNADHTQ